MSYTKENLTAVPDQAAGHGMGEIMEAHFARETLKAEDTGLAYHVLRPGKRQPFGHKHNNAEEISVVLSGSGRVKLDDEILELDVMDAIRIAPGVMRAFEAGPDGMEWLVFGPHHEKDGEMTQDWWSD